MPEKIQETVLSNLTDELASSFFDGAGSSNNVILPATDKTDVAEEIVNTPISNPQFDISTEDLLGDLLKPNTEVEPQIEEVIEETDKPGPGRPRKTELGFDITALFEDELLFPFDDDTPVKSVDDLKDLIKGNLAEVKNKAKTESLEEYKNNLPPAVKYILEYTENGGDDIESLLRNIGQARQISDLDLEQPSDQKEIIRQYLGITGWSNAEIEEEIESLLDVSAEKLKAYAAKVKPKLDKQQEDVVNYQLEQAKIYKKQQEDAQNYYVQNVVDTLKKGALGDFKLTKEEQRDLYSALVEERYQSINGTQTNRLGALLDKIQFGETPNYELLAEVTMLLSDPVKFKNKIKEQIKKEVAAETVKTIKSNQGMNKSGTTATQPTNTKTIKRLGSGFVNPF